MTGLGTPRGVVLAVAGAISFILAAYAAKEGIEWMRREPPVSVDIAKRPWVEQVVVAGAVSIDVPWPLKPKELSLPPEVASAATRMVNLAHEADGLNIFASVLTVRPGTPVSLDGAARGAIANVKTMKGIGAVTDNKRETTVLGVPAVEIDATVERKANVPLQTYGIVFLLENEFIQVIYTALSNQPSGDAVWKRIRESIRVPKAK